MSIMKTAAVIILCSTVLFIFPADTRFAHADYYKYTDKSGAVCMTNSRESVPPRYRATMKVIREETLDKKDKASRIETPRDDTPLPGSPGALVAVKEPVPAQPASALDRLAARFPWFKGVIVAGALLGAFLIVRKLASLLTSQLLGRLICLVFFLGAAVFVYKTYTDSLSASYFTLKSKFTALLEKSNRREAPVAEQGEKAVQAAGVERSSP